MAEERTMRLSQVARKLNVGMATISETLAGKGFEIEAKPNSKITQEQYNMLAEEFASSAMDKEEASGLKIGKQNQSFVVDDKEEEKPEKARDEEEEKIFIKNLGVEKEKAEQKPQEAPKKEEPEVPKAPEQEHKLQGIKVVGKIDLDSAGKPKKKSEQPKEEEKQEISTPKEEESKIEEPSEKKEEPKKEPVAEKKPEPPAEKTQEKKEEAPKKEEKKEDGVIEAKAESLRGLKVLGKIELPKEKKKEVKPVASSDDSKDKKKKKRPRKRITNKEQGGRNQNKGRHQQKEDISDKDIQDQIKATLARLSGGKQSGSNRSKYRREKKADKAHHESEEATTDTKTLKVTEFISANDLASLMDVSVNEIISIGMQLGMFISINQRLDAESITVIADEFGFDVEFITAEEEVEVDQGSDNPENLVERAPIVTIMGHVDHGKTSLLDYIRSAKVTQGEAGGITQHIGAYDVVTESGKRVAFLDTPGHEAFTAMRARGAKITDIVIIVVAADDAVMPQTKEAINHAQVAGVPIVIAINKVDKPNANPDKIREELSGINILVEEWGGKYQSQEVSAKTGAGIEDLLEKVLLEAEILELKADPLKPATGTVIEAELDRGRGYVTTVMVQAGELKVGDVVLAGHLYGKVKAMFDHRGQRLKKAGPATPVQLLGLDGAPQAGDKFNVMENEREAREIATKREQLFREQSMRTKKHITLDEIGRRLAIGSFKELNVIIKGDVDGSVEAISDSLLKLSTDEVQVNIIHKAVGQISESDVLLASASDAIIIGFQVRPSGSARKLAETEEIEIRSYSIIYDVINDVKDAMEGMLAPKEEEVITGNIEVREVFKISKVGTVAGCYVTEGIVKRNNQVRLIRDGIVVYTGDIAQLKRFKDDVNEVKSGYECGLSIKNFNDIKEGDNIEGFEIKEVKRTL